jgi:putative ABC transport system permease protein
MGTNMSTSQESKDWKLSGLVWSSFRYFKRSHFALILGIAAATAVIVGALVVGDSVRGSLRGLVLSRLANIESLMRTRHFFRTELVDSLADAKSRRSEKIVPLIILDNSTVEFRNDNRTRRASHVQVLAIDKAFIDALDSESRQLFTSSLGDDEIVVNQSLASELDIKVGDQVTLLLSKSDGVAADNPLGRRDDVSRNLPRQKVVGIVREKSIGDIRFQPSQEAPFNVFASLKTIQEFLDVKNKANAAIAFSKNPKNYANEQSVQLAEALSQEIKPTIEDFGLQLDHHRSAFPEESLGESSGDADAKPVTIYDYYQLSSKELLIDYATEDAVVKGIGQDKCTRLLAYLANSIQKAEPGIHDADLSREPMELRRGSGGLVASFVKSRTPIMRTVGRKVPYSIVVGISRNSDLNFPSLSSNETNRVPLGVVNSWLAKELELAVDDRLQIEFYEPETVDGRPVKSYSGLRVSDIVEITQPSTPYRKNRNAKFDSAPTIANDRNFTPSVPGITDQESISSWDVPFELELKDLILKQDNTYWDNYQLAPKIFVPIEYARQMFGSRFGAVTSIRVDASKVENETELRQKIERSLLSVSKQSGLAFQPIRQLQLRAATGTTPFDMLFLSLSFFVIVAAFMLVAILFRLGIQQRTTQLGILAAQGFSSSKIRSILLREFLIVSVIGSLIGIPMGLGYARLMVAGLESWWIGAIATNFLSFSYSFQSLAVGVAVGIGASMLTIVVSMRRISKLEPLSLLRGDDGDSVSLRERSRIGWAPTVLGTVLAIVLALIGFGQSGMARAGCFFGCGMLLLLSAWLGIRQVLLFHGHAWLTKSNLLTLALRAIRRNPLRSSLSIGLLAVATFLIASMGVFRMSPTKKGYGGFDLIGVSSQPIYENMGSPAARREAIGPKADELSGAIMMPFRMREGDDASCTNLFQAVQPTILGVSAGMQGLSASTKGFEFSWAASSRPQAPWDELWIYGNGTAENPFPVILDQNTAMWSLKQGSSLNSQIVLDIDESRVHFKVVGLLNNSILQGKLLIAERVFQNLFPKVSGYRYFLISTGNKIKQEEAINVLEDGWSASGMDVSSSEQQLNRLLGVQNTYISAFQALGALGLLLGTIGLVAVQLRSVLERRRELALMQAVGFSKQRIGKLLTLETILLLGIGFLVGVGCAALALIPYVVEVGPQLSIFQPLGMLGLVFMCGLVSAILAIVLALKIPLLASLRNE